MELGLGTVQLEEDCGPSRAVASWTLQGRARNIFGGRGGPKCVKCGEGLRALKAEVGKSESDYHSRDQSREKHEGA